MKKLLLSLATVAMGLFSANATTVTFDFTSEESIGKLNSSVKCPTAASTGTNVNDVTFSSDGINITGTQGSTEARIWMTTGNSYQYRLYKGATLTVASNEEIKQIKIFTNAANNFSASGYADGTWTGTSKSIVFNIEGTVQITSIAVSYGDVEEEPTPEPSTAPDPDTITGTITVAEAIAMAEAGSEETVKVKGYITKIDEISTSYGNATYYIADTKGGTPEFEIFRGYWVDGEKFTSSSQIAVGGLIVVEGKLTNYNGTLEITTGSKVLGYKAPEGGDDNGDNGGDDVDVSSAISVAEAIAKIADGFTGKALVKGYITSIDEINTSYGNATYFIADEKGGTPTLEVYRGYWLNGAKFSSEYQIQIGGLIYVEGDLVNYNGTYEFTSGSKVVKYTAPEGGDTPSLPEGVLYIGLTESIVGWDKVNDTTIGDFNGWKFQSATDNSPACAIANAYYGGSNHAANAKLQKEFDLTNAKNVSMSFEQAFGYYFPTQQDDFFRVYVICDGYTDYLTMRNYPAKGSGNWTGWETNEFDLSEYDGETIIIGFEYNNPGGSTSMAWELKNFYLYGEGSLSGIGAIEAEDAAPVYYNLQGVRVANPEKGLYIVVKGNKAEKVLF